MKWAIIGVVPKFTDVDPPLKDSIHTNKNGNVRYLIWTLIGLCMTIFAICYACYTPDAFDDLVCCVPGYKPVNNTCVDHDHTDQTRNSIAWYRASWWTLCVMFLPICFVPWHYYGMYVKTDSNEYRLWRFMYIGATFIATAANIIGFIMAVGPMNDLCNTGSTDDTTYVILILSPQMVVQYIVFIGPATMGGVITCVMAYDLFVYECFGVDLFGVFTSSSVPNTTIPPPYEAVDDH